MFPSESDGVIVEASATCQPHARTIRFAPVVLIGGVVAVVAANAWPDAVCATGTMDIYGTTENVYGGVPPAAMSCDE